MLGTVGYMAPEQVRGSRVGPPGGHLRLRVPCCTRCCPAPRRSPATPPRRDDGDPARGPAAARAGASVPPALEGIVRRCLEKRPEERFQSAQDLRYALEAVAEAAAAGVMGCDARSRGRTRAGGVYGVGRGAVFRPRGGGRRRCGARWRSAHLLALIGPSGSGKTSFLRAGVVGPRPARLALPGGDAGAGAVRRPGARAAPSCAGDPGAVQELIDFHRPEVASGAGRRGGGETRGAWWWSTSPRSCSP